MVHTQFKLINHPLIQKMSSSQYTFSVYLLTFAFSLQTIFGASPLFHFCLSSARNFNTNDQYGSNLKTLLGNLHKRCAYNKGAIIWYDNCLLKYLNTDFFHQIDNQNKFFMWNVKNVSNPTTFNNKTKELLSKLAK